MAAAITATLDEYAQSTIHHKVDRLIGHHGFTETDREDLEQDLAVAVLECQARYDASRGKPSTYISRCIEHRLVDLIRRNRRQCRDVFRERAIVYDDEDAAEACVYDGLADPDSARPQGLSDLRMDLSSVIARMPQRLRRICALLRTHSPFAISKELGVPKQRIYQDIGRIRERFAAAGMDGYL